MITTPEWRSERTVALFLLGAIAISPPFLAIFALDASVFGVPLLYTYLFAVWGALIGLLAVLSGVGKGDRAASDAAETPGAVPPVGGLMKESPASPAGRPSCERMPNGMTPPAREG